MKLYVDGFLFHGILFRSREKRTWYLDYLLSKYPEARNQYIQLVRQSVSQSDLIQERRKTDKHNHFFECFGNWKQEEEKLLLKSFSARAEIDLDFILKIILDRDISIFWSITAPKIWVNQLTPTPQKCSFSGKRN